MSKREVSFVNYSHLKNLLKGIGNKCENWEQILLKEKTELHDKSNVSKYSVHPPQTQEKVTNDHSFLPCDDSLLLVHGRNSYISKGSEPHSPKLAGLGLNDSSFMWTSAMATQNEVSESGSKPGIDTTLVHSSHNEMETSVLDSPPCLEMTESRQSSLIDSIAIANGEMTPQKPVNDALSIFFASPISKPHAESLKKPPKKKALKRKRSTEHQLDDMEYYMPDNNNRFEEETLIGNQTTEVIDTSMLAQGMIDEDTFIHKLDNSALAVNPARIEDKKKFLFNNPESDAMDGYELSFCFNPTLALSRRMRTSTPLRPPNKKAKMCFQNEDRDDVHINSKLKDFSLNSSNMFKSEKSLLGESVNDVDSTFTQNVKARPSKFSYPNKAQIEHFMIENAVLPKSDLIDISMDPVKDWSAKDKMKLEKYANLTSKVGRSHHAPSTHQKISNNSGWQGVQNKEAVFEERASVSNFFDPTLPSTDCHRINVKKFAKNMVCSNSEVSSQVQLITSTKALPTSPRGCDYGVNYSIINSTINCGRKAQATSAHSARFASDKDLLNVVTNNQNLSDNIKNVQGKDILAVPSQFLPHPNDVPSFQSAAGKKIQLTAVARDRARSLFEDIIKGTGDTLENNQPVLSFDNNSSIDFTHASHLETDGESSLVNPNGIHETITVPNQLEVNESVVTLSQSFIWRELKKNADKKVVVESKQLKFGILWSSTKSADGVQYFRGEGQVQSVMSIEPLEDVRVPGSLCHLPEALHMGNHAHLLPNVAILPSIEFGQEVGNVSRSNLNLGECSDIKSGLSEKNMNVECRRNMASDKTFQKSIKKVHAENLVNLDDVDNKENLFYEGICLDKSETTSSPGTCKLNQELNSEVGFSDRGAFVGSQTYSSTTGKTDYYNYPAFAGFTTAGGHKVSVNPKFLEKAKSLLSDVTAEEHESCAERDSSVAPGTLDDRQSNQDGETFPCFPTARGKLIDTSEIAPSKVQELFDGFDQIDPFERSCHSVNDKADLFHVDRHVADYEEQKNSSEFLTPFLSSGSGKTVTVSKEFLANARKCLPTCDNDRSLQKCSDFQRLDGKGAFFFSTGRGNPVTVSNDSLLKAKKFLQTCESDEVNDENITSSSNTNVCNAPMFEGSVPSFSTGRGKQVPVSNKSLEKVQKMFAGNFESKEKSLLSSCNLEEMKRDGMDMKIDAINVTNKFEIPFRKSASITETPLLNNKADEGCNLDFARDVLANERKNQAAIIRMKSKNKTSHPILGSLSSLRANSKMRVSLKEAVGHKTPSCHVIEDLLDNGVLPATLNVCSLNAEDHKFYASDMTERKNLKTFITTDGGIVIPDESGEIGKKEFHKALLAAPGVSPASVDKRWTFNHYRWIVWKLASMEKAFPVEFGGRCLTVDVVFSQLKFRYDAEITLGRRSSLKRIFERDDTAKRGMVLCIADVQRSERKDGHFTLLLTDGWYSIPAVLDELLNSLVDTGKIKVGVKLCIFGSELVGSDEACSPLDAVETISLKLHGNSTRRARWNCKLGFIYGQVPKFALSSLTGTGGNVVCVDVFVTRVYPLLYYEKYPGGGQGVIRSARVEKKFADDFESRRQLYAEKFYEKCEKEYQIRLKKDGRGFHQDSENSDSQDKKSSNDKEESLSDFIKRKMEQEKNLFQSRNVIPLLKIKLAGCHPRDTTIRSVAILTIWNATEEAMNLVREGSRLIVYNVVASSERSDNILTLNSSRSTRYQRMVAEDELVKLIYEPRCASKLSDVSTGSDEYDVVALIIKISDKKVFHHSLAGFFETALIADEEGRIGAILFQGGLAAYGVEGIFKQGALVACTNLKVFRNSHPPKLSLNIGFLNNISSVVTFKAFELSEFSCRPIHKHLSTVTTSFNLLLSSDKNFLTNAQKAVEEILKSHENKSSTLIRTQSNSAGKRLDEFNRNISSLLQLNMSDSVAFTKSLEEEDRVFAESFSSDNKPLTPKARPSGLRKNSSLPVPKEELKLSEPNKEPDFDFHGFSEEWICD